jgi:2-polyprenyl-6-methoxyphenol hydroxylase-like FAD-dependent oxidoreductase
MEQRILVVGGGIGGLVLARALAQQGVAVDLIERAPALRALGAGITLGANAMRALGAIGRADAVAARGRVMVSGAIASRDGKTLSCTRFDALAPRHGDAHAIHRGALHEALVADLEAAVNVRCGTTLSALNDLGDAGVEVQLSTGASARYRAVIGADGLRSAVRTMVFGANEPTYAGYTCWRWTGLVPGGTPAMVEQWGRGARVGLVPLGRDEVYAFFVADAPRGTPADPAEARVERVRARFADFGGEVPRVLAAMPDGEALLHHDIEEVEQSPWCRGSVALLGDAAHAMTPNFGQGAAMAIEDAVVLARELVAHREAPAALRAYEARRRPRVEEIQRGARRFGAIGQWRSPLATWARDLAVRLTPESTTQRALERIVGYGLALSERL